MIYSVCADRLQIHSVFILNVTFNAFLYSHIYPLEKNMIKLFTCTAEAHFVNFHVHKNY